MKTRKTEKHTTLVQDVMANIRLFQAQPPAIKKRIEKLITDEFLKRDDTDKTLYVYIP
jgi:hypothetical protein